MVIRDDFPRNAAGKTLKQVMRDAYWTDRDEKSRIILEGLKGEESIATICRREGIAPTMYYKWSKAFLEAGKRQLQGDTIRAASSSEITELLKENEQSNYHHQRWW